MAWCAVVEQLELVMKERETKKATYRSSTSEKKSRQRDTSFWAVGWAVRSTSVGGTSLVDAADAVVVGGMEELITSAAIVAGSHSKCAKGVVNK